MNGNNPNFIYAYDDQARQIIVINAETGERVVQKENRVLSILSYLDEQNSEQKLRKFAVWCAHQTNTYIKPLQKKFFECAEQAIDKKNELQRLQQLYDESEGKAIATDTVGLRQGSEKAPGFLASRECVNPDALEGAKNAARFHCLWAEINNQKDSQPEFTRKMDPAASKDIINQIEQEQVDYLLDLIGQ